MTCDVPTAQRIGLEWLRRALAPVADFGRRADDAVRPFGPGDEAAASAACAEVVALAARLKPEGIVTLQATLRRIPDATQIAARAAAGDALHDADLFELGRFADGLDAAAQAWDAAHGEAARRPAVLPELAALLAPGRGAGSFYLADGFGPTLAAAREAYVEADSRRAAHQARLAAGLAGPVGVSNGEEYILMRDATPEVPAGLRVLRETPAYRVVALVPDADALEADRERDEAFARLAACETAVRVALGAAVGAERSRIEAAVAALGVLDRLVARVSFTQRWGGCVPGLGGSRITLCDASLVPLRALREDAALAYTPISVDFDGVAILTGPNMGGKSAALATCGFIVACVALGVPPPARAAMLPLFDSVVWIGGDVGGPELLSAFGAEVVRVQAALDRTDAPALFLVDEFARTTGPREGRALVIALGAELARRSIAALVATHFEGVAPAAGVAHLAMAGLLAEARAIEASRDVGAALAAIAAAMDYRVVPGDAAGSVRSEALAIASALGLEPSILTTAARIHAQPAGACGEISEEVGQWSR